MHLEILILPFDDTDKNRIENLVQDLDAGGVAANVLPEAAIPSHAYDPARQQYEANALLRQTRAHGDEARILGVTAEDLYVDRLNFVFGIAESPGRAGVISLHRLAAGADARTFRDRAVKEAVHELGHTFGLGHCRDPYCVMHFSNCLEDTDRKGREFCPRCRSNLPALS